MKSLALLCASVFSVAAADKALELRIYHIAEGKVDAQVERFEKVTDRTFRKYNFTPKGYWLTTNETKEAKLIYLLETETRQASKDGFRALGGDADFKAFYKASGEKHGTVTKKADSIFLKPIGGTKDAEFPDSRVTELRMYSVEPGKIDEYIGTYEKTRLKLMAKHGAKTVGLWKAEDEQKWPNLVVLMLNYKDEAAGKMTISKYHEDPSWIEAEKEWNKNGRLTSKTEVHWMYPVKFNSAK